mmetsp:Transcript_1564/g.4992  ORF Transcript_1564/g.4992 Transcript_1564/m.4992 type:complete len:295 (+) Transcript_1564:1424-2308(+)
MSDGVHRRVIRYHYPGGTPKAGRIIDCGASDAHIDVLAALRRDGVDLERFTARVYDDGLEGWRLLNSGSDDVARDGCWSTVNDMRRCECSLEERRVDRGAEAGSSASLVDVPPPGEQGGFFGIGIFQGKSAQNLGTLWRSAYQLGASFAFIIGTRFKRETSDTPKTWREIPCYDYETWEDFAQHSPFGAVWVAVEMGGTPLEEFEHPPNCVYILGSEDNGLNTTILRACRHHVALPVQGDRLPSYNVAVSGAMLMYDREAKRRTKLLASKMHEMSTNGRDGVDSIKRSGARATR